MVVPAVTPVPVKIIPTRKVLVTVPPTVKVSPEIEEAVPDADGLPDPPAPP
jgi:hypothetical protein